MRTVIIIVFIALCSNCVIAQNDHLEPRGTYGHSGGVLFDYFTNNLFQKLQSAIDDTVVRFIMIPEFEPEKSFYLSNFGYSTYSIHVAKMGVNNLLGDPQYYKTYSTSSYSVTDEFTNKLIKLFQLALCQTKFSAKQEIDHDGTLYLFTAKDTSGIVRYAEKWSPIEGSNMNEFVGICYEIIQCGENKYREQNLSKVESRIDSLIIKLEAINIAEENKLLENYRQTYDIVRYMNESKDTVIAIKIGETINIKNDSIISKEVLVKNYYVRICPFKMYPIDLYYNLTTGNYNIEFIRDKDRGKNRYYARKRFRILDLR